MIVFPHRLISIQNSRVCAVELLSCKEKRSNRLEAKGETERLPTAVGIALPTV